MAEFDDSRTGDLGTVGVEGRRGRGDVEFGCRRAQSAFALYLTVGVLRSGLSIDGLLRWSNSLAMTRNPETVGHSRTSNSIVRHRRAAIVSG